MLIKEILQLLRAYISPSTEFNGIPIVISNNMKINQLKFYIGNLHHSIYYYLELIPQNFTYDICLGLTFGNLPDSTAPIINDTLQKKLNDVLSLSLFNNASADYEILDTEVKFTKRFKITELETYAETLQQFIKSTLHVFTHSIQVNLTIENNNDGHPTVVLALPDTFEDSIEAYLGQNEVRIASLKTTRIHNKCYIPLTPIFSHSRLTKKYQLLLKPHSNPLLHLSFSNTASFQQYLFGEKWPNLLEVCCDPRERISVQVIKTRYVSAQTTIDIYNDYFLVKGTIEDIPSTTTISSLFFGYDQHILLKSSVIQQEITENIITFTAQFPLAPNVPPASLSTERYPLCIEISDGNHSYTTFLKNNDDSSLNRYKHFPIPPFGDTPFQLQVGYDHIDRPYVKLVEKQSIQIDDIKLEENNITIVSTIEATQDSTPLKEFSYTLCYNCNGIITKADKENIIKHTPHKLVKKSYFDIHKIIENDTQLPFLAVFTSGEHTISVTKFTSSIKEVKLETTGKKPLLFTYKQGILYCAPIGEKNIALRIKKYFFRCLKILRFTTRYFYNPGYWLIGEDGGKRAEDNAFVFFSWLCKNKPSVKAYFVISPDNHQAIANLKKTTNNYVIQDSLKHLFIHCFAEKNLGSHSLIDTLPTFLHSQLNKNKRRFFFLSHGYTALKRTQYSAKSYNSKIRFVSCNSAWEKDIWKPSWGNKYNYLKEIGAARYDRLDTSKEKATTSRTILYCPTWRDWYQAKGLDLCESPAFSSAMALLTHQKLLSILEEFDINLEYYPHPYFQTLLEPLTKAGAFSKRVIMRSNADKPMHEAIIESLICITDFSSIAFDFNYLQKNVIFYQPDFYEYMFFRGSYVQSDIQTFGRHAYTADQAVNHLEDILSSDFLYTTKDTIMSQYLYPFKNVGRYCQRTFDTIKETNI